MKLTEDVINQDIQVSNLLRRVKVLATKLNQTDFVKWIDKELNGYNNDDKYPDYRKLSGQVKFWNPYSGWKPVIFPSTKQEEQISKRNTRQSIAEIEDLLKSKNNEFEMPYPADVANMILTGAPFHTKVSLLISRTSLIGVSNAVRSALQDWLINIEKQGIKIKEERFSIEDKEKAQSIKGKYQIGKIENFSGTLGENNTYQQAGALIPKESFWTKIFWYVLVAFGVIVLGNIISGIILGYII